MMSYITSPPLKPGQSCTALSAAIGRSCTALSTAIGQSCGALFATMGQPCGALPSEGGYPLISEWLMSDGGSFKGLSALASHTAGSWPQGVCCLHTVTVMVCYERVSVSTSHSSKQTNNQTNCSLVWFGGRAQFAFLGMNKVCLPLVPGVKATKKVFRLDQVAKSKTMRGC